MPIITFGQKSFSVSTNRIYTFERFNRASTLKTEEQDMEGQKPSTYIKGPGLDEVSFSVPLILQNGLDIRKEIDEWIAIKEARTPQMLILGTRPLSINKFLLVSVTVSEAELDGKGNYMRAIMELKFQEFARYGSRKQDTTAKKRINTNASQAIADGAKLNALEREIFGS